MTKIVKVLDKGGEDNTHDKDGNVTDKTVSAPKKVLQRHAVDAQEIVASDPDRFEILADDDETPIDEDVLGNPVKPKKRKASARGKKAPAAKPGAEETDE